MRKVLLMSLLLAQLAATAFAYTNKDAGFKTLSPVSDNYITAVGKNFYGFIEDGGRNAGYAEVLQQNAADKFFGSKFTTTDFTKKYNDILLLQRNNVSQEQILKLVDNPFVSPLFTLADGKKTEYHLEAQQLGRNKYIVVKYADGEGAIRSLYYTSANDKLYMLMRSQQAEKPQNLPESTIGVIGGADDQTEIMVQDNVAGERFLKKFKTIKPQPQTQALSFTDKTAGISVSLPDDWFYLQLKDNYNNEKFCFTAAMPIEAMREIGAEALDLGVTDLDSAISAAGDSNLVAAAEINPDNYYNIFRHGVLIGSVKMADGRWIDELFTNPNQSKLQLKQVIEEFKTYLVEAQYGIKSFIYDADITKKEGSFYLQTEINPSATDLYYQLFAEGKAVDKTVVFVLAYDRLDNNGTLAYDLWNGKTEN